MQNTTRPTAPVLESITFARLTDVSGGCHRRPCPCPAPQAVQNNNYFQMVAPPMPAPQVFAPQVFAPQAFQRRFSAETSVSYGYR
jgi:hypothetical protein